MGITQGTMQQRQWTRVSAGLNLARSLERARAHAVTLSMQAVIVSERAIVVRELQPADAAHIRETLAAIDEARSLLELALTMEPSGVEL